MIIQGYLLEARKCQTEPTVTVTKTIPDPGKKFG